MRQFNSSLRTATSLLLTLGALLFAAPAYPEVVQLTHWQDLIRLRPDAGELKAARGRRARTELDYKVQRIERARGPTVNFDEYSITITELPKSGPRTAKALFQHIRRNLDDFLDPDFASFSGYGDTDGADWQTPGDAPVGSVMLFRVPVAHVLWESAAVVVSRSSKDSWVFSPVTVGKFGPGEHPVSGNREFGYREEDGTHGRIFTRGVDRAIGGLLDPDQQIIFKGADALWGGFQRNVKRFIEANGGQARINNPVIRRPKWESPEVATLFGKDVTALRVEAELQDTLRLRDARRLQAGDNESQTWPKVLKRRGWSYLTGAIDLACADSAAFERKYRHEKLPGVHLTHSDFQEFYAEDRARKERILDFLKLRRRKPLNDCQKYILNAMQSSDRPVSVDWIVRKAGGYRKENPTAVQQLLDDASRAAAAIDGFFKDIADGFSSGSSPTRSSADRNEREHRSDYGSTDDEPKNGFNSKIGNIDFTKPDFDMGPGSTLGR